MRDSGSSDAGDVADGDVADGDVADGDVADASADGDVGDGGVDFGDGAMADASADGGSSPELSDLGALWTVEPGTFDPPLPVRGAVVTFVRPAIGSEPAGMFLQSRPDGPGVLWADGRALRPGDVLDFDVVTLEDVGGMRVVTEIEEVFGRPLVRSSGTDVTTFERDFTAVAGLGDEPRSTAGRLARAIVTLTGYEGVEDGFDVFRVRTAASESERLGFRMPTGVGALWGIGDTRAVGCSIRVGPSPTWRRVDGADERLFFSSFDRTGMLDTRGFSVMSCPTPRLVDVTPSAADLRIEFSRPMFGGVLDSTDFQVERPGRGSIFEGAGMAVAGDGIQAVTLGADLAVFHLAVQPGVLTSGQSYAVRVVGFVPDLATGLPPDPSREPDSVREFVAP